MTEKKFRLKMKVQKSGHTYIPEEIRQSGFEGDVELLPNHFTTLLVKPGTTLDEIKESLNTHLRHIRMAIRDARKQVHCEQQ